MFCSHGYCDLLPIYYAVFQSLLVVFWTDLYLYTIYIVFAVYWFEICLGFLLGGVGLFLAVLPFTGRGAPLLDPRLAHKASQRGTYPTRALSGGTPGRNTRGSPELWPHCIFYLVLLFYCFINGKNYAESKIFTDYGDYIFHIQALLCTIFAMMVFSCS